MYLIFEADMVLCGGWLIFRNTHIQTLTSFTIHQCTYTAFTFAKHLVTYTAFTSAYLVHIYYNLLYTKCKLKQYCSFITYKLKI